MKIQKLNYIYISQINASFSLYIIWVIDEQLVQKLTEKIEAEVQQTYFIDISETINLEWISLVVD